MDLERFLSENPPSYGSPSEEEIRRYARKMIKILIAAFSIPTAIYLAMFSSSAESLLIFILLFLMGGGVILFIMNYEIFKSAPRERLEQLVKFVKVFEPDAWACGGKFSSQFLVMKKKEEIYAFYFGFGCKLLRCTCFEEREMNARERMRIMLGRFEEGEKILDEFKREGYRFCVYDVESAILPHPLDAEKYLICGRCKKVIWYSWAFSPFYIDSNVLFSVLRKYTEYRG